MTGETDDKQPQPTATAASAPTKAGFVALAGAPNVGKSTLLNRVLGRRLSIATPKPQTTRRRVLGIHTVGPTQMVFLDTPGIHLPSGLMHERMVDGARQSVRDADQVCWMVDAMRGVTGADRHEAESLRDLEVTIALNKVDRVRKPRLLPLIQTLSELVPGAEIFPISARVGHGVRALLDHLVARLPEGPWLYEADALTDQNERFFVAELVREQLFLQLRDEIPYRVAVVVDEFEDRKKQSFIAASIYTDNESAKRILVGHGGERIREVGIASRRAMESFLGRHVYLDLRVRVRRGWRDDPRFLAELGL